MNRIFIILIALNLSFNVIASNEQREKRLVQEVLTGVVDGEPVFLSTKLGTKFLSLYTKSEEQAYGAIILLHGRGLHANWHNVTQPIRTILPEYGWDTLSLQMPVLHKEATFEDYVEILHESPSRIDTAIETLSHIGYKKIIIVSHSCGGQMMLHWLKDQVDLEERIDGLVNIGLGISNFKRINGYYPPLNKINVPVLDIYGSEDIVKELALTRWNLIRQAGHKLSNQIEISGAEHMFIDKGEILTKEINQWLMSL